jgi:WhiB family transcriptional regulator, redox-sensing transcriptional regulator
MQTTGNWWDLAACRSADPELFFPISATGTGLADIARAKAVCASCRVRQPCLDYAIGSRQVHGVWGGTSEEERRDLALGRRISASKAS